MAFCTSCGRPLNNGQQFCTNCGTKAEDANAQGDPTAPIPLNTVSALPTFQEPGPTFQPSQTAPLTPTPIVVSSPAKTKKWPFILIAVAAIALIGVLFSAISCSRLFFFSDTTSNDDVAESAPPALPEEKNDQEGDLPNLEQKEPEKESTAPSEAELEEARKERETAEALAQERELAETLAQEQEIYQQLDEYYAALANYDERIAQAAVTFNNNYLSDDWQLRETYSEEADYLFDEIAEASEGLAILDVPATSINVDSWNNMLTCYDDCLCRIAVICEAWSNSLYYDPPADYKEEILEPIMRDNDGATNIYLDDFNEKFPLARPLAPQSN